MILVSKSWPAKETINPTWEIDRHPHMIGRGSGSTYTYPDEMWHEAQEQYKLLINYKHTMEEGVLIKYEWIKGYPDGYNLLEGAVCSIDDKPEDHLPIIDINKSARTTIEYGKKC